MKRFFFIIFILSLFTSSLMTAQEENPKRAITVEDLWKMQRVGDIDLSPNGKTIAFSVTSYNLEENKGNSDIWLIDSDGKNFRKLRATEKSEREPKFSPDGNSIAYVYENQIWVCDLNGQNAMKLTDFYSGASGMRWSPDGKAILFISEVYPDCINQDCNKKKDEEIEKNPVKAKIITELMFRHWDHWRTEKRSHLFYMNLDTKEYYDLNQFSKSDVPPISLGSSNDYNFSPDGKEIAFTLNEDEVVALSTNNDVFIMNVSDIQKGKKSPYRKISPGLGNDCNPIYSPDGKYIAFTSMERAGFEADKRRLMLYDRKTGDIKDITAKEDLSVDEFVWSPDSKFIYFIAGYHLNNPIYKVDLSNNKLEIVQRDFINTGLVVSPDGSKIYFKQQKSNQPYEIFYKYTSGKILTQITNLNKTLLEQLEMYDIENFWFEGEGGTKVQSIFVKPPFFDETKKYPMILLVHGGPQGKWNDDFHYRWNLQLFASKGYVVMAPNPRGSTGYGQKFTDEISKDWGGKVYVDIMNGVDFAVKNFKYIDSKNLFAAGASYGGYMINWIACHTDRFNSLVSHDGTFNLESMYGTTEELWFPEWEYGGPPWVNRSLYQKMSPHYFVQNVKTPMLVVQGALDFRVPEGQAFELFTSLQRLGVESKLLYFPDETHFVQKPLNSKLWWTTVFDWFEKFKK